MYECSRRFQYNLENVDIKERFGKLVSCRIKRKSSEIYLKLLGKAVESLLENYQRIYKFITVSFSIYYYGQFWFQTGACEICAKTAFSWPKWVQISVAEFFFILSRIMAAVVKFWISFWAGLNKLSASSIAYSLLNLLSCSILRSDFTYLRLTYFCKQQEWGGALKFLYTQ